MVSQSKWLESVTKTRIANPKASDCFQEEGFFNWSANNFYRTSTNDMSQKTPVEKKSTVIPGYQGYRPRIHVNNHHLGKTIAEQAREVFKPEVVDTPINGLASTGFNARTMSRIDEQLHATSRRYGKSTMVATA